MELQFDGEVIHWRGPSPYHFVPLPEEEADTIESMKAMLTYGWGVIPVTAQIGDTTFTTSLFPKDGGYLLPVKDKVRKAEALDLGDQVSVLLTLET